MSKLKLPIHILVLDTIGALLVGIGLFEWFSGSSLVPENVKFENYYVVMIIAGLAMMGPAFFIIVSKARGTKNSRGPREI